MDETARPWAPDDVYPEALVLPGCRFLVRSEVARFILPESLERWPELIRVDAGPEVVPRPPDWHFTTEDSHYVFLQGVLKNGFHEHLYVPCGQAGRVRLYTYPGAGALTAAPLLPGGG